MANTVIRVYDRLSRAQQAREMLLRSGFDEADVQLVSKEDEAGPVQGNFTVGNAIPQRRSGRLVPNQPRDDGHTYDSDYARPEQRATILLTVETADEDASARAAEIMARYGAIDVDARTQGH